MMPHHQQNHNNIKEERQRIHYVYIYEYTSNNNYMLSYLTEPPPDLQFLIESLLKWTDLVSRNKYKEAG